MKQVVLLLSLVFCLPLSAQVKDGASLKDLGEYLQNLPKSDSVVEAIEYAIDNGNEQVKRLAAQALSSMTGPTAYKVLNRYCAYGIEKGVSGLDAFTTWTVRVNCAIGMAKSSEAAAGARLLEVLRKEDNLLAKKAQVWAIGELKYAEALTDLSQLVVEETDESLIYAVVEALGKIGDKKAFQTLLYVRSGQFGRVTKIAAQKSLDSLKW